MNADSETVLYSSGTALWDGDSRALPDSPGASFHEARSGGTVRAAASTRDALYRIASSEPVY
jgi:hypothetical protein